MKKNKLFLLLFLSLILITSANAQQCIYFFYGEGCAHCAQVEPLIRELEAQSAISLEIHSFEIYNNRSNAVLLNDLFDAYEIPTNQRGVPVVFIGKKYLIGDSPIINNLKNEIEFASISTNCPKINGNNITGISGAKSPIEKLGELSLFAVIGAAIVDSINPCAIAVLLILLGALLLSGNKKKAMYAGLAFTVSIYIAYFLFGLGLFSALQVTGLSYWFYKAIGVLAVIVGLANIKDFFWYGALGFVMEIPRSWRPKLKEMLGSVTSPLGAFIMGFAVCLFELPCTGGPYLVILGLLAEKTTMLASIPILLLYNLFFVLPLLVITALIYFGFSNVEKTTEWKEKNIRILHLIAGIIMLVLGAAIVFGLI